MPTISEELRNGLPQFTADVTFYSTAEGGKELATQPGWGCVRNVYKSPPIVGYGGWPLLKEPLNPGQRRRVGFVFFAGDEALQALRKAGIF